MYYLYIDESGDDSPPKLHELFYDNTTRFFVVGGIIVDDAGKSRFEQSLDKIMAEYFSGISLPSNFKLHYEGLRNKRHPKFPYTLLTDAQKYEIVDKMFDAICSIDCRLVSVSINVTKHFYQYAQPASPRAYTLLALMERFQYFLQDIGAKGEGIYEKYDRHLRHRVESVQGWLVKIDKFPKPVDFVNVSNRISSGEPSTHRVLQFTDFFVYTHYMKNFSKGAKADRWHSIKHKYYNLDYFQQFKRGNYDIEYYY